MYKLIDTYLRYVRNANGLGFRMFSDLSFDLCYEATAQRASYRICNLFKLRKTKDSLAIFCAYKTYVRPV